MPKTMLPSFKLPCSPTPQASPLSLPPRDKIRLQNVKGGLLQLHTKEITLLDQIPWLHLFSSYWVREVVARPSIT